jgi:dynein heavy chain
MRYNKLISLTESSLQNLKKALEGNIVMTPELEEMVFALRTNTVPLLWKKNSYPSLLPLNEWIKDFYKRAKFFSQWMENGAPKVYWLPGFYYPKGLFTAVLQKHSRATKIPIDHLKFEYHILDKNEIDIGRFPDSGL